MWVATGSYLGYFPIMPGTVGTLVGIPLVVVLQQIPSPGLQLVTLITLWLAAIPICSIAARRLGQKDPGAVVIDEILSFPLVFAGFDASRLAVLVAGFVAFRVFDIIKLPPARQLERLPNGLGVMADDVAAAVYAWIALWLLAAIGLL
jgi:phosphatidylglycerophosphatase A